jgi:hypothetical protein
VGAAVRAGAQEAVIAPADNLVVDGGFRKKPNQDFQFYTTVEFLQKYLLQ